MLVFIRGFSRKRRVTLFMQRHAKPAVGPGGQALELSRLIRMRETTVLFME
jgi:hypothetical protein